MTPEEAIEMLGRIAAQDTESGRPECVIAEWLGIEALKWYQEGKKAGWICTDYFLPGETKE